MEFDAPMRRTIRTPLIIGYANALLVY